ncbi:MAG: sulfoxide reductase heme-binding subunit YedZ [Telmatospirillum sp.]|nr:sulfoxide reductase heme-binding subunit YedZ [Telmatospirillum sp.]
MATAVLTRWRRWDRPALHLLCALPLLILSVKGLSGDLGANPIEALVRGIGDWALRLLVVALAVTPIRRLTGLSRLAAYRRMLGLWAFAYVVLHLSAYIVLDQFFDWQAIAGEIRKHKFITAGILSVILLLPLAATSTGAMVRRLGGVRWKWLHRLVYLAVPLAGIHYLWMVKADTRQPIAYLVLILLCLGARLFHARHSRGAGLQ